MIRKVKDMTREEQLAIANLMPSFSAARIIARCSESVDFMQTNDSLQEMNDALLIQKWKPWEKSTGPKTPEGKKASSLRWLKHGMRSAEVRNMESAIAALARMERVARNKIA